MLLQAVALRYTSIIRVRVRMPGRVDHGGAYALLGTAGSPPPNIATGAQAIVRYPRAAASSSVQRLAPNGRRDRPERRFEECDVIAIGDGCYLDSTFFTGANDPVELECRPAPPAGRKLSSQKGRRGAVRIASRARNGIFCVHATHPRIGAWLERCCLSGRKSESAADSAHGRMMRQVGTITAEPCRRPYAGTQDAISYVIPRPALEHCSS